MIIERLSIAGLLTVLLLPVGLGCRSAAPEPAVSSSPAPEPAARQFELRIDSTPPGAAVTLDGHSAGSTPVTRRYDEPAVVVVEVSAPGHAPAMLRTDEAWWLRSAAAQAARRFGRSVVIRNFHPKLTERIALRIESEPVGGTVTVNGEARGPTPLLVDWDGVTPLALRVTRDGLSSYADTLDATWWRRHRSSARLDAADNVFTATVPVRLSAPIANRWTRVGQQVTQQSVAVQSGATHQTVPAIIRGPRGQREVSFLFDTGATYTTLDSETARSVGLDFDKATSEITAHTANGVVTQRVAILSEVEIGGHTVRNVAVLQCDACRNDTLVGLLGLNVSREFSTHLSADGRKMTLTPSGQGAGRLLTMRAFLDVPVLTPTSARFVNKCDRAMRRVVVEMSQQDAKGQAVARVRTKRFTLPAGGSKDVAIDLTQLVQGRPYELRVLEGQW